MARGKSVTKMLLDSSQAALFAGIEIHNKPHIDYRYPTSVILIINAWELALKAYVYKYIGRKKIYEKDGKHTITFSKALVLTRDDINSKDKTKNFLATHDNLFLLNEYRCSKIHFAESKLDPVIFMLISKAVLNYDVFLKKYFKKDITRDDNLIILPIGLKLPFDPIEYLKQNYGSSHNEFINDVIQTVKELDDGGIQDSIVVGFNLVTDKVKNVKNADIVAAISNSEDAVELRRGVRITDDPNAPLVRVEPELPPLRYSELRDKIKDKDNTVRFGTIFNQIMKEIKLDSNICRTRYLDPNRKSGTKTDFYYEQAVDEIIKRYNELEGIK